MIGTDLTKKQMTNVVRHLADLAKPWVNLFENFQKVHWIVSVI